MINIITNRAGRRVGLRVPAVALALAVLAAGCGPRRPAVHVVRGQVLVGDRPAARALVMFHPVGDARPEAARPVGETDDEGRFTLTTSVQGDGAPEGEYQVTVTGFRAVRAGKGAADDYVTQNALPDRYARVETSGLRATVAPRANDLEPFRLQPK
jgi:hypothetical protein